MSVCLSVCLSVYVSICPRAYLRKHVLIFLSVLPMAVLGRPPMVTKFQGEGIIFGGCPGHSKALAIFAAAAGAMVAAKGIIQSPITSCSRRDHSVCQASANRNPENSECRRCCLSATKGVMAVHRAPCGRSVISTIALFY